MPDYVSKNGLLYTNDLHTVVGIDTNSNDFNGRIPYGAHEIVDEAFAGCTCESISLPDSVKELPPCLFENLQNIKSVKLPSTLQSIPPYLFSGCSSLTKVSLPSVVTAFSEGMFKNCTSLQEIPFRAGIQEVPESFCEGCKGLKSVVMPNSVAKVGSRAFANCTGLETVVFSSKMYELADDAFEGCTAIHNIRMDEANNLFYINEEDGCLYEKSIEGEDKLRLKIGQIEVQKVDFYETDLLDNTNVGILSSEVDNGGIIDDEDLEEDDVFSSEIGASDEELGAMGEGLETNNIEIKNTDNEDITAEENKMAENNVDDMLADIMGEEKARVEGSSSVAVSDKESAVLSEVMDVMADSASTSSSAAVSAAELENLFASNEASEPAGIDDVSTDLKDNLALDSKTKILIECVGYSKIETCEPEGEPPADYDLFVIAEKILTDENEAPSFSPKLEACVKKIARIHDFKRIIMLYGLPSDNDEFNQFYFHFMNKRNIILACEADSPATLSDYGKMICENSRISLDNNELAEQRKCISIKNDMLIKLVIQDKFD